MLNRLVTFTFLVISIPLKSLCTVLIAYHPVGISHSLILTRIGTSLLEAGENVTFIHFPVMTEAAKFHPGPEKNFIVFDGAANEESREQAQELMNRLAWSEVLKVSELYKAGFVAAPESCAGICRLLGDAKVVEILRSLKPSMAIMDPAMANCVYNLMDVLDVPFIESSGVSVPPWGAMNLGVPYPGSYVTGFLFPFNVTLNFGQRLHNYLDIFASKIVWYFGSSLRASMAMSKPTSIFEFDPKAANVSHYLANDHIFFVPPRPLVPTIHLTGGQFLEKSFRREPLPEELESFMQSAKKGVLYVSLGTVSPAALMSQRFLRILLQTFTGLSDYHILWKTDLSMKGYRHIKTSMWFPQRAILAHPKILAMVTHGGLNTVTEASFAGVPLIGMPLFGDQPAVLHRAHMWGSAEIIPKEILSADTLTRAVRKVLTGKRTRQNARRFSRFSAR